MSLTINHQLNSIKTADSIIGTATNTNTLNIGGTTTGALVLPKGTTSERDTIITAPVSGMIRYNTTTNTIEQYNGTAWGSVAVNVTGGTGFLVSDGTNNIYSTLQAGSGIAITNPTGTSGNPVVSLNAATTDFNNVSFGNGSGYNAGDILIINSESGFTSNQMSIRNIFPAGDLGINPWQLGVSGTPISLPSAGNYMTADRFYYGVESLGNLPVNFSRSTDVPSAIQMGTYINNSLNLTVSTANPAPAANQWSGMFTYIEGREAVNLYGRPIVMDFWFKSSKVGTYHTFIRTLGTTAYFTSPVVVSSANTWTRYVIKVPAIPAAYQPATGTGMALQIGLSLYVGANFVSTPLLNTWTTTRVNAGSGGVNFLDSTSNSLNITNLRIYPSTNAIGNLKTYSRQQVADYCMRYYEVGGSTTEPVLCNWGVSSDFRNSFEVKFKVEKRTQPTITWIDPVSLALNAIRNYSTGVSHTVSGPYTSHSKEGFLPAGPVPDPAADNLMGIIWRADSSL